MTNFVSLNDVADLKPMSIRTTQRTKTFYFRPVDGWKPGFNDDYRVIELRVMEEMSEKISCFPDVKIIRSRDRYFEFYLETDVVHDDINAKDNTDAIRACICFLMSTCRNENLTLVTVGV